MQLIEWLQHYVKFKDCIKKQILSLEIKNDMLLVKEKKEIKTYFVADKLQDLLKKTSENKTYYVCLNSKENINLLIENWQTFINNKNLTLFFAHPKTNEVWLINPNVHHNITEQESLKEGIQALHESITQA